VFKTLVTDVDVALTCRVVQVSGERRPQGAGQRVGAKRAAMADRALAERTNGYVRGESRRSTAQKRLPTVLDASASAYSTVYVVPAGVAAGPNSTRRSGYA